MRILIYGDSNSWGYLDDGKGIRYDGRWTKHFAERVKPRQNIEILEDCLPGRTSNCDDTADGIQLNGEASLLTVLATHSPLNHVILMLGTNDFKNRFNRKTKDIAASILALASIISLSGMGSGSWSEKTPPELTIICPPKLGVRADDSNWKDFDDWKYGREKSLSLANEIISQLQNRKIHFIDSNEFIESSKIDPIHWNKYSHKLLGVAVANYFLDHIIK